jgi:hypothetical protein
MHKPVPSFLVSLPFPYQVFLRLTQQSLHLFSKKSKKTVFQAKKQSFFTAQKNKIWYHATQHQHGLGGIFVKKLCILCTSILTLIGHHNLCGMKNQNDPQIIEQSFSLQYAPNAKGTLYYNPKQQEVETQARMPDGTVLSVTKNLQSDWDSENVKVIKKGYSQSPLLELTPRTPVPNSFTIASLHHTPEFEAKKPNAKIKKAKRSIEEEELGDGWKIGELKFTIEVFKQKLEREQENLFENKQN